MTNTLLTGISSLLVQVIFSILGLVSTYLIGIAALYLNKRKQALITQIGVDKYNSDSDIAKAIYFQVEQAFKFIPGAGDLKATMFDSLLLAKIPGLTQTEIDHFRESVVGEINSQLTSTQLLAPAYNKATDEADITPTKTLIDATTTVNTATDTNTPTLEITPTNANTTPIVNPIDGQPIV